MDKYKNKYRIPSARLQSWDYRWAGAYFITICTANRIHYLGEIENGKMVLSPIGVLADVFWHEIKNHAQNVELGAFVVMPNHVHGILILTGNDNDNNTVTVGTGHALSLPSTNASTNPTIGQQRFQNIGKNSVSSIVGSYKSAVTKHAHRLGFEFAWQTRFYDHIIRNDESFQRISNYIINNPVNWQEDKLNN
ncbi:MAG TPA: transposase [Salinivirgaceae bacterium]|nr:transposase [Salinivirgaceae bacterium]